MGTSEECECVMFALNAMLDTAKTTDYMTSESVKNNIPHLVRKS